jgi:hypothetical protein
LPASKGPVVEAEDANRLRDRQGCLADSSEEGIGTCRHRQAGRQPGTRFTAQKQANLGMDVAQPARGARKRGSEWQSLSEDPPGTVRS